MRFGVWLEGLFTTLNACYKGEHVIPNEGERGKSSTYSVKVERVLEEKSRVGCQPGRSLPQARMPLTGAPIANVGTVNSTTHPLFSS